MVRPGYLGGKLPTPLDRPLITSAHTIIYDSGHTTIAGLIISKGATLVFDSARSLSLQSTTNIVVEGILQMRPAAASHIHTLRFINIDETKFEGGMNVMNTDTGLWVMGAGQLDLAGAAKTAWTHATHAIPAGVVTIPLKATKGWQPGDEISITPTEPPTVGNSYTTGFDERTIKAVTAASITISSGASRNHPWSINSGPPRS
ncbi:G8 domain-containing protein [Paraflavitalea speifideaquila]|uniref:G8 domain-containing protein n=1 Tax=Paraflavitalea speifideaquila TaxID=3076558 RepID=UPI0028E6EA38|nr:G8 domain-containing protein [Paraflavitalea speifideiaquila]